MAFDLPAFTLVHVLLSVLGIIAGLVLAGGLVAGVLLERWSAFFLVTTILTSVTGFGFPATTLLPSHVFGILSLLILPVTLAARYWKGLAGGWCTTFIVTAMAALYLNVFVLFAQLFQKVPALAAIAPTPESPVFGATQLLMLALFAGLTWAAVRGFRNEPAASGR